jgi:hypothetical protein
MGRRGRQEIAAGMSARARDRRVDGSGVPANVGRPDEAAADDPDRHAEERLVHEEPERQAEDRAGEGTRGGPCRESGERRPEGGAAEVG